MSVASRSFDLSGTALSGWWMLLAATCRTPDGRRHVITMDQAARWHDLGAASGKLATAALMGAGGLRWDDPVDDSLLVAIGDNVDANAFGAPADTTHVELLFLHYDLPFYATWNVKAYMAVDNASYPEGQGLTAAVNNTSLSDKHAYSVETVSGIWQIRAERNEVETWLGLRADDTTGPVLDHPYAFNLNNIDIYAYEAGIQVASTMFPALSPQYTALEIHDTGTAIEYWMETPDGVRTLFHTSAATYTPGATWYIQRIAYYDGTPFAPVQITQY